MSLRFILEKMTETEECICVYLCVRQTYATFWDTYQTKDQFIGDSLTKWGQKVCFDLEKADFWVNG